MTHLLYQTDSYLREFDATVVRVEGDEALLDRTAFYPGGGGQPADRGVLRWEGDKSAVVGVRKAGEEIWHALEGGAPSPGQLVRGAIEWERRYALMRAHTALHILCGIVWRDYGARVTGGNMDVGRARMDFELEAMSGGFAEQMQEKVRREVEAARPISVRILPRAEAFAIPDLIRTKINLLPEGIREVRVVEIAGLDVQADGGTHVRNTSEVGEVRIIGHESKGRINKRLRIEL